MSLQSLVRGRRQERWQRIAVSSAKQCGRAVVPVVREPQAFDTITGSPAALPRPWLMFVEPGASSEAVSLNELDGPAPVNATLLVGPEGGWTADEVERGSAVGRQITLGARTLRADAMALVALAALFTRWGEL